MHSRDLLHHHGNPVHGRYPPIPNLRRTGHIAPRCIDRGRCHRRQAAFVPEVYDVGGVGGFRCDGVCVYIAAVELHSEYQREDRLCVVDWGLESDLSGDQGYLGVEYCLVVSGCFSLLNVKVG